MNEKQQTKQLWKQCFNDSDEFIDLYFNRRYTDDRNMAIYQGEEVIAALQMIPYTIKYFDEKIKASYISGAATAVEHRKKGIMTSLLEKTHKRMYDDGVALSFLIPAGEDLFDYYSKRGYATIFYYSVEEVPSQSIINLNVCDDNFTIWLADDIDEKVFNYYSNKVNSFDCAVLHDYDDLSVVIEDIKLTGGKIAIAKQNNADIICGVAFGVPDNNTVFIKEYLSNTREIKKALFYKLMNVFNSESIFYKYYYGDDMLPYGMARVINMEKLLSAYAKEYKPDCWRFLITGDKEIQQNNGYYIIIKDKVYHFRNKKEAENSNVEKNRSCDKPIEDYDIRSILNVLFENVNPYMNSMMD